MRIVPWLVVASIAAPIEGNAQRAECPLKDAPLPTAPPGKPPAFTPQVTFPSTFGGEVKVEAGVVLPPQEALIDVEEGQLTAIFRLAKEARHEPPSAEVLAGAVDLRKTRLSAWRFDGYLPNPASLRPRCDAAGNCSTTSRHKVTRVFSKDDSTVLFEDWNMAADGAALVATPPQTVAIGRFFGNAGALRSPSGCASASLSWHGEGKSFSLTIFGPLSLQQQREVLLDLARSIEMAAPKHGS